MELIRETLLEDAPKVAECIAIVAHERRYIASTTGYTVEETQGYIDFIQRNSGVHLVLLVATLIVGWCDITPGLFEGMEYTGYLTMGLLPGYRRNGWGKKLLEKALEIAFTKRHFERIELEAFSSNHAAISLYHKTGFQQEGYKRKVRILEGQQDDMVVFGMLKEEWLVSRSST